MLPIQSVLSSNVPLLQNRRGALAAAILAAIRHFGQADSGRPAARIFLGTPLGASYA